MTLRDIGEKKLISDYLLPLLNPDSKPDLVGDDCAVCNVPHGCRVCISTDRVPSDLIAFKHGIIEYRGLGYYLATLNISDIAAAGGTPIGILLNLGMPRDTKIEDFLSIVGGAKDACDEYNCHIIGGDLSDSRELNLVATSLGTVPIDSSLYRSSARPGDLVFCSRPLGLTPSAFHHIHSPTSSRIQLSEAELDSLFSNFTRPKAMIDLGLKLSSSRLRISAMDNTDGIAQSLTEIATASNVALEIDTDCLPIHPMLVAIASRYKVDVIKTAFAPGADFQIVGTVQPTISRQQLSEFGLHIIGRVAQGNGLFLISSGIRQKYSGIGWNYWCP